MPLVHINGTGQFTWFFSVPGNSGDTCVTLGFQSEETDMQGMVDKAMDAMATSMMDSISIACALLKCKMLFHRSDETESWESFHNSPVPGTGSSARHPASVAVLVQKRTAFAGRKNRGRFYFPGIPNSDTAPGTDPNALTPGALTQWQTGVDALFAALKDDGPLSPLNPVILHPSPSTTVTEITSFSVQSRLATQRNRLRD